ncbi:MAG: carboxypeptidase regulatory-like domain-containing protein, partial [Bacteroidaceae bacterium]|nr:carboxypeptidase regulatory-like domain-containing protein [Bacteroidaceae bacterium]
MKKSLFFLLALFSIFTNISCEEELPELYGNIHGIVYDKVTSEPIRGAEITLAPGNKTTVTGLNGQYEFNDLDPMQYEIQVSADGYSTNSRLVTAIAGESVICDITLSIIKDVDGVSLGNSFFDFGSTHTEQTLIIKNIGNKGAVNWEITNLDAAWLKAKPMNGPIAEGK